MHDAVMTFEQTLMPPPPREEIKPRKQASRWHCFGCSVNLMGGSEFAEDVSLNAAAQLEHKHVDMCFWIFLLQLQSQSPAGAWLWRRRRRAPENCFHCWAATLHSVQSSRHFVVQAGCNTKSPLGLCAPLRLQAVLLYRDVTLLPISFTVNNQEATP